jgi:hypothetical protein
MTFIDRTNSSALQKKVERYRKIYMCKNSKGN